MASEREAIELIQDLGGCICSFEIGDRTDPVFFSFVGRLVSVSYAGVDDDVLMLHIEQQHMSTSLGFLSVLGHITFSPSDCKVQRRPQKILIKDGERRIPIAICQIANTSKGPFSNRLEEVRKTFGAREGLECPHCGKECSSTSGLTLHKKTCKEKG